jgi:[protein-PII] uridylyltransferase
VTAAVAKHQGQEGPLVLILDRRGQVSEEGATEICIITPDRERLFATTVSALSQLGLSVHDASIHTAENGWCMNSFIVLDESGRPPGRSVAERERLTEALTRTLSEPDDDVLTLPKRRLSRQLKQLPTTTEVTLTPRGGERCYELTLIAADRPGLLAGIGVLFADLGVDLIAARIATLGERVEDVFTIRDAAAPPEASIEERAYLLTNAIRQGLDAQIARELG